MRRRRSTHALHPIALACLLTAGAGCTPDKPSGSWQGLSYELDIAGSYSLFDNGMAHVWGPADPARPILMLQLSEIAEPDDAGSPACGAGRVTSSEGLLVFPDRQIRAGWSVDVVHCVPNAPHHRLTCSAYLRDGRLPAARREELARACRQLRIQAR